MHAVEVEEALETLTILVDTREHPGKKLKSRMEQTGCSYERCKLDFGDYSARVKINDTEIDMSSRICIERKMDGNELAMCFGRERGRFEREFDRAKETGARIYLLVENENFEKIYAGRYGSSSKFRSKLNAKSFIGSLFAWQARYDLNIMFCKEETTGKVIRDILYYETREVLLNEYS
jgi:ERCC4-type nuclease